MLEIIINGLGHNVFGTVEEAKRFIAGRKQLLKASNIKDDSYEVTGNALYGGHNRFDNIDDVSRFLNQAISLT
jgi:hypothetical protein